MRRFMKVLRILRMIFKRPRESCLLYAPWRAHFGVHAVAINPGRVLTLWRNNPLVCWTFYKAMRKHTDVKAAFFYVRLTRHRPAIVITAHVRNKTGVHHVKSNAQQ